MLSCHFSPMDESGIAKQEQRRRLYSAEKARQGEIVLRARWQKLVFFAGLAGAVMR